MVEIPVHEIDFHPTSFCDRSGRVFWWNDELYRGIRQDDAAFYTSLFDDGIVQRLVDKGFLIETELTDQVLNGFPLVLKHRRIPFVSYANEWCSEMLRDAALTVADMALELTRYGLRVDADTWDLLFDNCRPLYVDFCSIVSADSYSSWRDFRDDFRSYFIFPLHLMAQGYGNLARWLLADYQHEDIHAEFAALMGHRIYNFSANQTSQSSSSRAQDIMLKPIRPLVRNGLSFIESRLSKRGSSDNLDGYNLVRQLRKELVSISLPVGHTEEEWNEDGLPSLIFPDIGSQKYRSIRNVLSNLRPATVLDIGSGQGQYSQLAASLGSRVVAIDSDDRCVAYCYQQARKKNLPILPLVMNINFPSPGFGLRNQTIAPALQRLPCDMVLALSLVHLLVFDQYLTFELVSQTLAAFSKRWLLVEFISREDQEVRERWSDWYAWYTLENFFDAVRKQFRNVSTMPSYSESRVLLLCEK